MGLQKNNCPCWREDCGSRTACTYYYGEGEQPHFHCHKCDQQLRPYHKGFEEHVEYIMLGNTQTYKKDSPSVTRPKPNFPQRGIIQELKERCITAATAEKYGVETLFNSEDKPTARAYPGFNHEGTLVSQKIKPFNKDLGQTWSGDHGATIMFGQKVFPKGGKFITITEGEEDAMAAYQMLKEVNPQYDPAVLSVNDGCKGAIRDFKRNYEYINSFENIILAFDGDEVGQEAAHKVAQLFPLKCKIVKFGEAFYNDAIDTWSLKDANDYLKEGRAKDFVNLWYKAEKWVPQGVCTFRSLWDDMVRKDLNTVVPFPWDGLNQKATGLITGMMDVYKAFPKIGKTTILSELVIHIKETSPHNVGVIFLENTKKQIGLKFCGIKLNKPLDRPGVTVPEELLKEAHDDLSKDDRITVFDPEDERTVENIFNKIVYFVKAHDCKYLFLDHASMLAYASDDGDERRFLDKLFADLKKFTTSLNIYLGVVIHVNDDGKTRGSRAPIQLCDRLFSLSRDKLSEDETVRNTMDVTIEENRFGDTGLACKLLYDSETGRYTEMDLDLIIEQQKRLETEKVKGMFDV